MKWLELSVESLPEYVEPLCQLFSQHGHRDVVVEEEGGYNPDEGETRAGNERVIVRTYIPLNTSSDAIRSKIDLGVRLVAHFSPISILREKVMEQEDWIRSWKDNFHVLRIGKNVVVVPSWREYNPKDTDVVIKLDPGMAFGTGHHPTTRMCLELMEKLMRPGMSVLDVGCGSAILSIAAAGMGASGVLGLEIDPVVVGVARSNVRANGFDDAVEVIQGALPNIDVSPSGFDIAVANISAKVISEIAGNIITVVKTGGKLIISGVLQENIESVARCVTDAGARIEWQCDSDDWVSLVATVG